MFAEGNERNESVWIGAFLAGKHREMKSSFIRSIRTSGSPAATRCLRLHSFQTSHGLITFRVLKLQLT